MVVIGYFTVIIECSNTLRICFFIHSSYDDTVPCSECTVTHKWARSIFLLSQCRLDDTGPTILTSAHVVPIDSLQLPSTESRWPLSTLIGRSSLVLRPSFLSNTSCGVDMMLLERLAFHNVFSFFKIVFHYFLLVEAEWRDICGRSLIYFKSIRRNAYP